MKIFLLFLVLWRVCPFRQLVQKPRGQLMPLLMSGYIPPERDREYRNVIKKSLLQPIQQPTNGSSDEVSFDEDIVLPIPKEGDIVLCPSKWKGENMLGRIRYMQWIPSTCTLNVEVLPLKEGKADNVFMVDRNAKSFTEKVENLKPVLSFFLRSENGYKVAYRRNTTEVVLKAPGYRPVDKEFKLPLKTVNIEVLQSDLEKYNALKVRMITNTLKFGAVGTLVSTVAFGTEVSIPYLLGTLSASLYLVLLGKKVDGLGTGFTSNPTIVKSTKLDDNLAKGRLLVPLLLVSVIAAKNILVDGHEFTTFNLLSKEQFLGAMAGFLTYRVALLITELGSELRTEDILSIAPGSMAEAYRQSKNMEKAKGNEGGAVASAVQQTVVLITGPRAAGRSKVVQSLLGRPIPNQKGNKYLLYKPVKLITVDTALWQREPGRFRLVTTDEYNNYKARNSLLYEGEVKGLFGQSYTTALCQDDVDESGKGGAVPLVVEGPPAMLDSLSKNPALRLVNIWISLQTKEQFIAKATQLVQDELSVGSNSSGTSDKSALASKSSQEVSELVNEAARDITYYMSKAPLFEYALLNSGTEEETIDELDVLLKNTL